MGKKQANPTAEQYYPANWPGMRLAQAYIPYQIMNMTYSPFEALQRGTLFPELYQPYTRRR
ncbi:MAG: spore coat associated protein CotJA [Halanaerobium sp.]|nr:spore coat associated protein CotJA [Halanaerobium sp.]